MSHDTDDLQFEASENLSSVTGDAETLAVYCIDRNLNDQGVAYIFDGNVCLFTRIIFFYLCLYLGYFVLNPLASSNTY